jgi:hypothetical protein
MSVLATQIDRCKVEGIAKLVKKTQYDGYWDLVYDVQVFTVLGEDDLHNKYCQDMVKSKRTRKGLFRVSTGIPGTAEPTIPSADRQWFIWGRIDSGMFVGESFAPVLKVSHQP